ncbi:MAG TPA: hypothetical protein PLS49_04160 [Candidatus Woesebacteria bacterium]|nr:hypothetical protein [Candidatus Woesebacteria bacterium]
MKVPIKLPEDAEVLIQAGQTVDFSTPLLRKKSTKSLRIPLAEILKFSPDKIFLSLKKVVGDVIKKGDLLAENKGMFATKQYFSSVDGIIREIDHLTGSLGVELQGDEDTVMMCFFQGEVDSMGDGYIELKVDVAHKLNTQEHKTYFGAPVFYIVDVEKPLTEDQITERIIVGETINPLEHAKIETLGAKGFITLATIPMKGLNQIVISNKEDLEHVLKEQYPFFVTGVDNRSVYFYK